VSEHVSPLLQELHWLRVPERLDFRLAVSVYRCINGTAPRYLASELQRVADTDSRVRLLSSSTALLHVPWSLHIGDRAFPVAAARVWNMLPPAITSLPSLQTFKRALRRNCLADRTTTHTSGNSSIDTSLTCDIYCSPEVLFETCIAMKFVYDDDDDDE